MSKSLQGIVSEERVKHNLEDMLFSVDGNDANKIMTHLDYEELENIIACSSGTQDEIIDEVNDAIKSQILAMLNGDGELPL